MEEQLQQIIADAEGGIGDVETRADLEAFKARFMGGKGSFTKARKGIGALPNDQKPVFGKRINEVKNRLEELFSDAMKEIERREMAERIGPPVDPSLPAPDPLPGSSHLLTRTREEICNVFRKIGFSVAEGPEVETDWYCFEALNIPAEHPARDMQDTYFLPKATRMANVSRKEDEPYVLRTHTSPVQVRTMLAEDLPLRIISPGRCFRRDTVDATHSANFHQVEGLYVDERVTVMDLKAVLDFFVREVFGAQAETRFRPSYFPFTEPSFEMDVRLPDMGKLSNKWLEIMGCGMVNPAVFENVEIDPDKWTGYAFGMGVERIAMLLSGVDDIRRFYTNDLRFLRQF